MKNKFGITAVAVLVLSGLGVAAHSFTAGPAPVVLYPVSDSERRVERCMAAGGIEESCIYEEMKRTMLVDQS
jgi:hypothetical protein